MSNEVRETADAVEAVARAICSEVEGDPDDPVHYSDFLGGGVMPLWQRYTGPARAVIAALQSRPAEPAQGGCANCHGMIDDLAPGRDPEELCDTCYHDVLAAKVAEPAGEEPVAEKPFGWFYEGPAGQNEFHRQEMSIPKRWTETPVYARPAPSNPDRLMEALRAIVTLRRHSREDDADNALTMQDMAEAALVRFEKAISSPGAAQRPTVTDWRNRAERAEAECQELLAQVERHRAILPSAAGTQNLPDGKVIPFYVTLGEIRALAAPAEHHTAFKFGGMSPQAEGEAACDQSPRKRGIAANNFPKSEGSKANG